jgi:cob(I)alamin adenosyltransferase
MTLYFTKTGDKGQTGIVGNRLSKSSQNIEAIGAVDEANSAIGVALSFSDDSEVKEELLKAQNLLFTVGAELAGKSDVTVQPKHIEELENVIVEFGQRVKEQTTFLLPSGTKTASLLHHARAICRRAEREVVKLHEEKAMNPEVQRYLNRLSSLLFILARYENKNIEEKAPEY